MKPAPASQPPLLLLAAVAMLLALVGGLGLAMWMENGAAIFLSLLETGLAWCF